jgi:hypothetical protein
MPESQVLETISEPFEQVWEEISDRVTRIAQKFVTKPRIIFVENKKNKKNGMIYNYLRAKGYDIATVDTLSQLENYVSNNTWDCFMVDSDVDVSILNYLSTTPKKNKIIGLTKKTSKHPNVKRIFDCIIDTTDLQLHDLTNSIKSCLDGASNGRTEK